MHPRTSRKRLFLGLGILAAILGIAATQELVRRVYAGNPENLVTVGFACREAGVSDGEVGPLVDEAIASLFGAAGLDAILDPGDKVVIKVNLVGPKDGPTGAQGLAIITDPRVVRHVAQRVRDIIGWDAPAELTVVDACFADTPASQDTGNWHGGFYWARLERTGDDSIDAGDVCYDYNHDGILDGGSGAVLVNTDTVMKSARFMTQVYEPTLGATEVWLPKFLRTPEQAAAAGEPDTYCDALIGLPVLKSHRGEGITAAMKLHYGLRTYIETWSGDTGRSLHSGTSYASNGPGNLSPVNEYYMDEYLCAQHRARTYDVVIVDALMANRRGPSHNESSLRNTDWLEMNAILAGTDPIALDTVCTLFAGYDQATVKFLRRGALDGLGTDDPGWIRIAGLDAYTQHRDWLFQQYNPSRAPTGISDPLHMYPFVDGWADCTLMEDFDPPRDVTCSEPRFVAGPAMEIDYAADDSRATDLGLARVELLIDGAVHDFVNATPAETGTFSVDLDALTPGVHTCQIAAWDEAFGCTVSAGREFSTDGVAWIEASNAGEQVLYGAPVTFELLCSSTGTITYQWRLNGVAIPGATGPVYGIASATEADAGVYDCVYTVDGGPALTATAIPLNVSPPLPLSPWWALLGLLALLPWALRRTRKT